MTESKTDRIEKEILLKAPIARVWQAISDPLEFGTWFRVDLPGAEFSPNSRVSGQIREPGYEHMKFEAVIERVEPPHVLSFRWHPYAVDAAHDYSSEASTLVEFELKEVGAGTLLRVVESGFDAIPLARRASAFSANSNGWAIQVKRIEEYVAAQL
jgi:uncharacterized protein YndB with AHSA1/START domain